MLEIKLFVLIVIANGAPIIARELLGSISGCPVDGGLKLPDNKFLFGRSKTVRGIIAALVLTAVTGILMGVPLSVSLSIALFAMLGDLFSSFIKRRLNKPAGSMVLGLDQIPESLLPLLAVRNQLGLEFQTVLIIVSVFIIFELVVSRLLYKLNIRDHPY